jgi:hypothetical protein
LKSFFGKREREREREREDCNEGQYLGGGVQKSLSSVQKVPRQCQLVLLLGVKHMIGIDFKFNFHGVRGAAFQINGATLGRHF